MEPKSKKFKTSRKFRPEWEEQFAVCEYDQGKAVCCLCGTYLSCLRTSNFGRHLATKHPDFNERFPLDTEGRLAEIQYQKSLRCEIKKPSVRFDKITANKISYELAYVLAKHQKPYKDVEEHHYTIKCAIKHMFEDTENEEACTNFLENLPLSRSTVTRRTGCISKDLTEKLKEDLEKCLYFSMQFNESTHVEDTRHLIVFVRMVFDDLSVKEELLSIVALHDDTNDLMKMFSSFSLPFQKLVSVTSGGACIVTRKNNEVMALLKENSEMENINHLHCIIYQQALCLKSVSLPEVEDLVVKITDLVKSHSKNHPLYKILTEKEDVGNNLKFYAEVSWLSKGIMLDRFYKNLTFIVDYLKEFGESHAQLSDFEFLSKLAFLVDLMSIVKEFNLQLEGKNKPVWEYINVIDRMKQFLVGALNYFSDQKIHYKFTRLQTFITETYGNLNQKQSSDYCCYLNTILLSLNNVLTDFDDISFIYNYLVAPFDSSIRLSELERHIKSFWPDVEIPKVMADVEKMLFDKRLKEELVNQGDIWKVIVREKSYTHLLKLYQRVLCCFGSTYMCESSFSYMKLLKNYNRNKLSDDHLNDYIRISMSTNTPDIEKLAYSMHNN